MTKQPFFSLLYIYATKIIIINYNMNSEEKKRELKGYNINKTINFLYC